MLNLSMDFTSQNMKYNIKCFNNRAVVFFSGLYIRENDSPHKVYNGTNSDSRSIFPLVYQARPLWHF